jgi:hypothetical protein
VYALPSCTGFPEPHAVPGKAVILSLSATAHSHTHTYSQMIILRYVTLRYVTSQFTNTGLSLSLRFVKAFVQFRREILLAATNQRNKNEINYTNDFNYIPRLRSYRAVNTLRLFPERFFGRGGPINWSASSRSLTSIECQL